jgi:hypothetical protein
MGKYCFLSFEDFANACRIIRALCTLLVEEHSKADTCAICEEQLSTMLHPPRGASMSEPITVLECHETFV